MVLKKKIAIALLAVILAGAGGTAAYFYFSGSEDKPATVPEVVEEDSYVFPYTGLKTDDEKATKTRPLCVKIPNDSKARPQTGINSADVVYETMVEGGETRLNAIFQSNVPEDVGPVRSARLSDLWIVPQYNGMLFFSGANDQVRGEISAQGVTDMRWDYAESIYFRADNGRGNLHNLHIKLNGAYEVAKKRDYETTTDAPKPLHFEDGKFNEADGSDTDSNIDGSSTEGSSDSKLDSLEEDSNNGNNSNKNESNSDSDNNSDENDSDASHNTGGSMVNVKIGGSSNIEFKWDSNQSKYLKWMNGVEHKDDVDDKQVNVDNVVIIWAEYIQQAKKDAAGSPTYDTNLGGTGKASVFKGGERYDGEWKADKDAPPRFYDDSGEEILLNPGKTWIVVPPLNINITSQ